MPDVQFPHIPSPRELAGDKPKLNWRRKRVVIPALLVGLIAVGSVGGEDKESPQALLSVTAAADSKKVKEDAEQAARDLAEAQAEEKKAAEAEAAAEAAAAEKAAAEQAAAEQAAAEQAAADKAAAEQAAAEKAAAEKAAAEKAAADRAAAEKAAADKAAAEKAAADKLAAQQAAPKASNCTPEYPDFCIPPAADYNCPDFKQKNFRALAPDPYRLDADKDGIACESR